MHMYMGYVFYCFSISNESVILFDKTPLTLTVKFPDYGVNEDIWWGHMPSPDRHSESS